MVKKLEKCWRKIPNLTKPTWSQQLQMYQLKIPLKQLENILKCADY